MKKIFLTLFALSLVQIPVFAAAENIIVSNISGNPQILRGNLILPLKPGTECQTGDILTTSAGCNVDVALNGIAGCRVLPSSRCVISNGASSNMRIEIKEGNAILNLKKLPQGSTFEVETPTAVAAVRGTQFWGRVVSPNINNPITTFAVRQGVVNVLVKKAGKIFSLKKGQALDIPMDAASAPAIRPALSEELQALDQASSIKTSA